MPPGDIKALGVQLPSQPPLPPGEQELGRCLLLLWLETSINAVPLLGRDFHMFPFSLPVSRSILILCTSAPRDRGFFGLLCSRYTEGCLRGSVVGIQGSSPAWLGSLILEMSLSLWVSKIMCLNTRKKKRLCFPNMQNKFSRMLEGRDLEAAVCHVALIELVLQSCYLGIGNRSLWIGFSQPSAAPQPWECP